MNTTTSHSSSARLPIVAVLLAAFAAGLGLWAGQRYFAQAPTAAGLQAVQLYPAPRPIPDFSLEGGDGQPLDKATLRGRWTLVFAGFTHCPDVCPTTLATLATAAKQWQDLPAEQRPRLLFISVDPERDSAQRSGEYAAYFAKDTLAATAEHAVLEPFTRSLGMVYMKSPLSNGDYTVDHSASIALLDPEVRLAGLIRPPLDAAAIGADLRRLQDAR